MDLSFIYTFLTDTWNVAIFSGKFVVIVLFLTALYMRKYNYEEALVYAYRSLLLYAGPYVVLALVFGGVIDFLYGVVYAGALPLIFVVAYLYAKRDFLPVFEKLHKRKRTKDELKRRIRLGIYAFMLLISLLALSANPFLESLSALLFLGVLFWEI